MVDNKSNDFRQALAPKFRFKPATLWKFWNV